MGYIGLNSDSVNPSKLLGIFSDCDLKHSTRCLRLANINKNVIPNIMSNVEMEDRWIDVWTILLQKTRRMLFGRKYLGKHTFGLAFTFVVMLLFSSLSLFSTM